MEAPLSIHLNLEGDEVFEAGSVLRGDVQLQWSQPHPYKDFLRSKPSTSANLEDEKKDDGNCCRTGTVVITLEGFEQTTIVRRRYRYGGYHRRSRVFQNECRILHKETSSKVSSDNGTALVDFSLDLPQDLPSTLVHKYFNTVEQGNFSILYRLTAKWKQDEFGGARDRIPSLSQSKFVDIRKRGHSAPLSAVSLTASSRVEIPVFFCGCMQISTNETFSLKISPSVRHLNLCPNQTLQLVFQDAKDRQSLCLNSTGVLMAKLTQKLELSARKGLPDGHPIKPMSWELPVDYVDLNTGAVSIPCSAEAKTDLHMSYTGRLIEFQHELIVYVLDSTSHSIVATSQPIPVILSPGT
jgi:hypothetical protein